MSRRPLTLAAELASVAVMVASCGAVNAPATTTSRPSRPITTNPVPGTSAPAATSSRVASTTTSSTCSPLGVLARWPVSEVAAQTIAVPVEEADVASVAAAVESGVGGLLLFGTSAPADLGSELSHLRSETPGHRGLLVMADEEGGGVQRMANLVGSMPWPRQMAETMTTTQVFDLTRSVAEKMARNGVNVDLAPVLDVDGRDVYPSASDPDGYRSFGGSTAVVSRYGLAYLEGLMAGGVLPVAKHFPGLGGASGNTDYGPATTLPWPEEQAIALPPFETAIAHGVPIVMTSNAVVPKLTKLPASISVTATRRVLRGELKFHGLIITDSLSAGALADIGYSVAAASVAAIEAGADMVLYSLGASSSADVAQATAVRDALVAAVSSGHLTRTKLDGAAAAVLAAKHVELCG